MLSKANTDHIKTQNKLARSRVASGFRQSLFTPALSAVNSKVAPKSNSTMKFKKGPTTAKALDSRPKNKNPDQLKFQLKDTLFDSVNQSATESSIKPNIEALNQSMALRSKIHSLNKTDSMYQDTASIQARSNVQKKVLNQQVNALMSNISPQKLSESMQKGFQNVRDQTLQSKFNLTNTTQKQSLNPSSGVQYKIEQSSNTMKELKNNYLDEQFFSLRPNKNAQRFSRASLAMSANNQNENKFAGFAGFKTKSMLAVMIASVFLTLATPDAAFAARSGGRMGGRAGGSSFRAPPRMSAPRSAPRAAPSGGRTIINNNYGGGYGRGGMMIMPGMGYGFSPFGFGGGLGMGYGGFGFGYNPALSLGLTFAEVAIREQQRQAYLQQQLETQRQLGQDQAQIASLSAELQAQNQRIGLINAQASANPNRKYDEGLQKEIEARVSKDMESKLAALQSEFKIDMDKGDFQGAEKVKQEAQLLLAQ